MQISRENGLESCQTGDGGQTALNVIQASQPVTNADELALSNKSDCEIYGERHIVCSSRPKAALRARP